MKKYIIYSIILLVGLLLGWLLFGGSLSEKTEHNHSKIVKVNKTWTCSMHPQIMQLKAGDCPICGMNLIIAENSADGLKVDQFKLTKNAMALANIQTTIVGEKNVDGNAIKLSGKIAENEKANAVQISYFSGRIERLNVSFTGEKISKGQLLATIYSPELYAAQQELITVASLKGSQLALYKAVRNKLKLWKVSEKQINQIEATGKVKENFPVYSTVSGTVIEKLVEEGDYIKQGQPLLKINNLNTVWANFDVYENQIELFEKGQEVSVSTNAYANKVFKGEVDFIDPILNSKTRTVNLRVVLNNKDDVFKPGMFVSANIDGVINENNEALSIPESAILWTGERSVVYLKTNPDQPVFEMREVMLGNRIENEYEVLEGLFAGNEIVTNGTFTIDAAAQLQGKKSMMNKGSNGLIKDRELDAINDTFRKIDFNVSTDSSFQFIIEPYIELKDALVQSDVTLASIKSKEFRKALDKISVSERVKSNNYWSMLYKTSKKINENVSIEYQREQFKILSEDLITMVRNFDKVEDKLFIQFCPMADNNKGAYWLSKEEKVINPYYGKAMLTCGEVKQIIE